VREIASALIVGAGAVGSAVASILHRHEAGSARILASPERRERWAREGFVVNGERVDFPLVSTQGPSPARKSELIILAVKCHQLGQAIRDMAPFVGDDTLILSLLNGITSEDELAAAFGRDKVPYAMVLGIDAVREGNSTVFAAAGKIHFGDATNLPGAWSERVSRIASFFDRAGQPYVVPEDMVRTLWYKFMINVGVNQASAILRAGYGAFQSIPEARSAMEAAMREVIAISAAKGTGLVETDPERWQTTLRSLSPGGKTSMLQDVEAGRKTEVEAFAGAVMTLGRECGIPTPVNQLYFDLIRAMEQGYA
jgi:2-dehydropantoate 2-reductase